MFFDNMRAVSRGGHGILCDARGGYVRLQVYYCGVSGLDGMDVILHEEGIKGWQYSY